MSRSYRIVQKTWNGLQGLEREKDEQKAWREGRYIADATETRVKIEKTRRNSCSTIICAAEGRISSALLPMLYAEKELLKVTLPVLQQLARFSVAQARSFQISIWSSFVSVTGAAADVIGVIRPIIQRSMACFETVSHRRILSNFLVGIGVEFTVHMCVSFLTSLGTRDERIRRTLDHMFVPVTQGGLSTLLGIIMLAFNEFQFIVR